jgi:SpoIIAA-like
MSATYRLNDDVVEMTLNGTTGIDEVIQTFHQALDDSNTPEEFVLLLDVRESSSLATRPTSEIIKVAEYLGPFQDRVKRCAVLATENIHFGLSRLGAVYSETAGVMTSVFRDKEEAIDWLHSGE